MNLYELNYQFFATSSLLIGVYVYLKRQDLVGKYYLAFSLFVAGWGYHMSELLSDSSPYIAVLWADRIGHFDAAFIPLTWLGFVRAICGKSGRNSMAMRLAIGAALIFSLVVWFPAFIPTVVEKRGYRYYPVPGPLYHFYPLVFIVFIAYGFKLLVKTYKSTANRQQKKQLRYLLVGYLIAFVSGICTFVPVYNLPLPKLFLLPISIYPFVLGYAITNYGLLDMEAFVSAAHRLKLMTLGMFSASINHEIKNPAYLIKGGAEAFIEKIKDGYYENRSKEVLLTDAAEFCQKSTSQIVRVTDIIERFSAFLRPSASPSLAVTKGASIQKTVETVLSFTQYADSKKKIAMHNSIEKNIPNVAVDERELEEIIFNLIVNAHNALSEEGNIYVSAERSNGAVRLSITDTGSGISPEHLSHIFEPFFSRSESGNGNGLGLYITKHLVEKNKGTISVTSKVGKGTQFNLTFKASK